MEYIHPRDITRNGQTLEAILAKHLLWLGGMESGERADLSGAKLSWAKLRAANLHRIDLSGADLSGANLRRADLRRADLRDADLSWVNLCDANLSNAAMRRANLSNADLEGCVGNMREIKSLQIERWSVAYTADTLQIGCQRHPISEWREWNTDAGRDWIADMESDAAGMAERFLPLVLQIIDASPATPTGHEANK